jgi:predicted amidohydrolase
LAIRDVAEDNEFVRTRKIPVACIQTRAHDRDAFSAAWPRIVALVDEAAARGAKLIVLPEATVPGYVLGSAAVPDEQLRSASADVCRIARTHGTTIVYGSAKNAGGTTLNAALVVGPEGAEIGFAAKQFLWHFDRRWFAPGASLEPVETPLGRLGLLVCADGRIPTIAATLVERGAELLVMPTAWVTSGRDPGALENVQADLMINVRARENGVPFVAANKSGVELESVAYCGKSALVDASGRTVARAGERSEEILLGELEIGVRPPAARPPFPAAASAGVSAQRARIAFSNVTDGERLQRLRTLAAQADADVLLAPGAGTEREIEVAGIRALATGFERLSAPRGLVEARLAGIDLFVVDAADADADWLLAFARTRAAELRAYVVAFGKGERAFAVDPDGTVVAGTFDGYRTAAFVYDSARSGATQVAPQTDVLTGLRTAEALRAQTQPNASLV